MDSGTLSDEHREELIALLAGCYCPVLVKNPEGEDRQGFFNVKRLLGRPSELRRAVEIIGPHIKGTVLCAPDHGSAPLVAALAFHLNRPSIYLRVQPKHYYLSFGASAAENHPLVFGERIPDLGDVSLIDDAVSAGTVLLRALTVLREIGATVRNAYCLLNVRGNEQTLDKLRAAGIEHPTVFARAREVLASWRLADDEARVRRLS